MTKMLRGYLKKLLVSKGYLEKSFSQDSEDVILEKIFINKNKGFYVDIGAHHPIEYSNTYKFYLRGWTGVNIDPRPGIMEYFNKIRPKDINIEIGIGEVQNYQTLYMFDAPGVNTFNKEIAYGRNISNGFKLIGTRDVRMDTLMNVLENYVGDKKIDFLNVDVEGYEIEILKQMNWNKYKPNVIICEALFESGEKNPTPINCTKGSDTWCLAENLNSFQTHNFLLNNDYGVLAKGIASVIYVNKQAKW